MVTAQHHFPVLAELLDHGLGVVDAGVQLFVGLHPAPVQVYFRQ